KANAGEMRAARMLIDTMAQDTFEPEKFKDTYTDDLMNLIEARAHHQPLPKGAAKAKPTPTVVDLMGVLQKSLAAAKKGPQVAKAGKRTHAHHAKRRAS